MNTEMKS